MHVQDISPETGMSKYSDVIFHFGQPSTANLSRNRHIQVQWRHVLLRTASYSQSVQKQTYPDTVTSCSTSNSQVQPIVPDTSRLLSLLWILTVRLCRRVTLQTVLAVCRCSAAVFKQGSESTVQTEIFRYNLYPEDGGTIFLQNVTKLLSDDVTWRDVTWRDVTWRPVRQ
jgi:hypothetical protein